MTDYEWGDLCFKICDVLRTTRFKRTTCHICGTEFTAAYIHIDQLKTATCGGWRNGCVNKEEPCS